MTVSSEPPGSLGWLFFTLVLKSAFAVIWLKCVSSVAIISIEPPSGVQCILLLLYEAAQQCHSEGLVQGSLRAYLCGLDDCSLTFEPMLSLPRFYLAAVEIYLAVR